MYKIGQFSSLAKTTIKTLRYYEKEKQLIPDFIDDNGYRYYSTTQLTEFAKIISLKQVGLSIQEIKQIKDGNDITAILLKRKLSIENLLKEQRNQLLKINYLLKEDNMEYEVIVKTLPDYTVYYMEGVIEDFSKLPGFILGTADECTKANPNIECVEPGYCYVNYLDGEYKEKNIKVRYSQAVKEAGIETGVIKFEKLTPVEAVCIYHKGSYDGLRNAYSFIMKYIENNGFEVLDNPRECYIDGMWNKDSEEDWLTEIQVPIKRK